MRFVKERTCQLYMQKGAYTLQMTIRRRYREILDYVTTMHIPRITRLGSGAKLGCASELKAISLCIKHEKRTELKLNVCIKTCKQCYSNFDYNYLRCIFIY